MNGIISYTSVYFTKELKNLLYFISAIYNGVFCSHLSNAKKDSLGAEHPSNVIAVEYFVGNEEIKSCPYRCAKGPTSAASTTPN